MEHSWHYLNNQFITETDRNYKKAVKLSNFHDAALKKALDDNPGDPDWLMLYTRYHPVHNTFVGNYTQWISSGGAQEGETLNLMQQLKLMTGKINTWDIAILAIYPASTPRYKAIFPDGHNPFFGSIDARILAIKTLSQNIGSDAALATVKSQVDAYYTLLLDAHNAQTGAKTITKGASSAVDQSRIAAMTMQYADLGFMLNKLAATPHLIAILFDVETLTNPEQTIWKGHLDQLEIHPTLIHTFTATDLLRIKSTGNGDITAYLATTPGGTDSTPVVIAAKHELKFAASAFGITDYSTHRFLTIVNNSATTETRFLVELY